MLQALLSPVPNVGVLFPVSGGLIGQGRDSYLGALCTKSLHTDVTPEHKLASLTVYYLVDKFVTLKSL